MNKTQIFFKKHSSTILTVLGSAGVVATSVLAVQATPKALKLIEDEKQRREESKTIFNNDEIYYEKVVVPDLTTSEIIKIAWKPYIPAVVTGISTIACILGANYLSKRTQASLMSAYALLNNSYKEYREKAKELFGEDANRIEEEIVKSKLRESIKISPDKELFFDFESMQHFESTLDDVLAAEKLFNQNFVSSGFAYLNDFYEILGIKPVDYGYDMGWSAEAGEMGFRHEKAVLDDGLECWIISMDYPSFLECEC